MQRESMRATRRLLHLLVSVAGLAAATMPGAQGQTFKVVRSFTGGSDGANPVTGFTLGAKGTLFGTASSGGSSGLGVVYKVTPKGVETVLHGFTGGPDGATPNGGVIEDAGGALYGTTTAGG